MTTSLAAPVRTLEPAPLPVRIRVGQGILTAVLVLMGVVGLSTTFADDPFPAAAVVLIASFSSLAATLGIVAVWGGVRSTAIRVGLFAVPLFFVWHVAALGTWIPDAALAILALVGAVLVAGAGGRPTS